MTEGEPNVNNFFKERLLSGITYWEPMTENELEDLCHSNKDDTGSVESVVEDEMNINEVEPPLNFFRSRLCGYQPTIVFNWFVDDNDDCAERASNL